MELSQREQKLIKVLRESGTDITFILIHMANLYEKQAHLDEQAKRVNVLEMKRRANLYYLAYNDITHVDPRAKKSRQLTLIKNEASTGN